MSNIRKSFNFRNGVQVDEDNFIVNPNGLVGIGTSVPTEFLDVRGTTKIVGLATVNSLYAGSGTVGVLTVTKLNGGGLSAETGIITSSSPSGIVTYYGDGGKLINLPTSQWIDVDSGFGYTSIYAAGNVGVGTTYPDYTFQVGGTPGYKSGVGVNSTGDIYLTGIITAGSHGIFGGNIISSGIGSFAKFLTVGSGATITGGIVVSGGSTFGGNVIASGIGSFTRNLIVGSGATIGGGLVVGGGATIGGNVIASGIGSFAGELLVGSGATIDGDLDIGGSVNFGGDIISSGAASFTDNLLVGKILTVGSGATIGGGLVVGGGATIGGNVIASGIGSFGRNLTVGSGATIGGGLVVGGGATVANDLFVDKTLVVGTSGTFGSNLYVSGIATVTGRLNASSSVIGNLEINAIQNTIYLTSGSLTVGASGGKVSVTNDLGVIGVATVGGTLTSYGGVTSRNILLGTNSSNIVETSSGNLTIRPSGRVVTIENNLSATGSISAQANLNIGGISTFSGNILATGSIRTENNLYAAGISTLNGVVDLNDGSSSADIEIGLSQNNLITTKSASPELQLNSYGSKVKVLNDLAVQNNFYSLGFSSVTYLLPNTDLSGYLGQSNKRFLQAHIRDIQIGVSGSNAIESSVGNLTFTSAGDNIEFNNNVLITGSGNKLSIGQIILDNSASSIGIGTTAPTFPLDIISASANIIGLKNPNNSKKFILGFNGAYASIIMGSNTVGSGKSVASIGFNDSDIIISNEHFGSIISTLDNSTSPVGMGTTGRFVWKYGRNNTELLSLSYQGNLSLSGIITVTGSIVSQSGISSFKDTFTGDLTSSSITANSLGVTGEVYCNILNVSSSPYRCAVDFSNAGNPANTQKRFMLPPVITTTERTGLTTVAGAIIYNSTINKHQGWNGTAWFDLY